MPARLSYVDFIPRLVEHKPCFSTLSLSSGVLGPSFETYDHLVDRANKWLRQNPEARVISCETMVIEGWYDMRDDEPLPGELSDDTRLPAYINTLRIWVRWSEGEPAGDICGRPRPCQLAYRDVLPARMETNPEAFGPKYESLTDAIVAFNQRLAAGTEHTPGRLLSAQTCVCRFTTRNCSVDPTRTFWMAPRKTDVHCYSYFRLFYTLGPSETFEIGFVDFQPIYSGDPRRQAKSERFVHLTRRAEQWCQSNPQAALLNVQTLDHLLYFRCVKDNMASEGRVLDTPHCVLTAGQNVFHTKVLRLYHVRRTPPTSMTTPPRRTHLLHKTFHLPTPFAPPGLQIDAQLDGLMPHRQMQEVMNKICRWVELKGVKVTGVETVRLTTGTARSKGMITAEDTHFESHAARPGPIVYAVRLFIEDAAACLSKKDLVPDPRHIRLAHNGCTLL